MRFTLLTFAGVAAAGYYQGAEPVKSSSAPAYVAPAASSPAYVHPVASSSSAGYVSPAKPTVSSKSSSSSVGYKPKKTSTIYSTSCWTETSSSVTKTWTSVKAIPTICDDDEEADPVTSSKASSTPYSPVKPTKDAEVPYCSAYTETCTVTVTATGTSKTTADAVPVKPTTPAAPVYPTGGEVSPVKPSGTGSPVKPYPKEFEGAASAQKAGAFLAGLGAIAALLL